MYTPYKVAYNRSVRTDAMSVGRAGLSINTSICMLFSLTSMIMRRPNYRSHPLGGGSYLATVYVYVYVYVCICMYA